MRKGNFVACADTECPDQTAHPRSLIWTFAVRLRNIWYWRTYWCSWTAKELTRLCGFACWSGALLSDMPQGHTFAQSAVHIQRDVCKEPGIVAQYSALVMILYVRPVWTIHKIISFVKIAGNSIAAVSSPLNYLQRKFYSSCIKSAKLFAVEIL